MKNVIQILLRLKLTIFFAFVKVLDLWSTYLNIRLTGDPEVELNPIARSIFVSGWSELIVLIMMVLIVFGLVEWKYGEQSIIRKAFKVTILVNLIIVITNFVTYFYSNWLING